MPPTGSTPRLRRISSAGTSLASPAAVPRSRTNPSPTLPNASDKAFIRRKKRKAAFIITLNRAKILKCIWGGCAICLGIVFTIVSCLIFLLPWGRDPYDAQHHRKAKSTLFSRRKTPLLLENNNQQTDLDHTTSKHYYSRPHLRNTTFHDRRSDVVVPPGWERGPWAIFYNIYIPISDVNQEVQDALSIVDEQLTQIAASPACSRQPLTLYYNLIGNAPVLTQTEMQQLCRSKSHNLDCQLLAEYESATESVTLRQLHGFCRQHADFRVTYLHTKGSFHVSTKNTNWRRLLTAAAVAPECVNPPNATCNLCGLMFFTQFTFFIPGNMFTAHCSYVRELLPFENDVYAKAREQAVGELMLLKLRNQLKATLLWDQRDFLGLDRYMDEHWVGSHPDVVPCDMDPLGDLLDAFDGVLQEHEFEWSMGPRNTGICGGIHDELQGTVRNDADLRRRELLLLPGLLTKWYTLYGRAPSDDSWVWDFFPDGRDFFLKGVHEHGADVVNVLTDRYRFSADGSQIQSAFASDEANTNYNATTISDPGTVMNSTILERDLGRYSNFNTNLTIDTVSSPQFALFYHIGLANERDGSKISGDGILDALEMVTDQLTLVKSSFVESQKSPVTLFYGVAGHGDNAQTVRTVHEMVSSLCDVDSNLHCRPLLEFDVNYEGETLRQLHRFCERYPAYRVSYFHNQAPMQLRNERGNSNLMRHMTRAVTNQLCLQPEKESCNVCGLIFYTMWAFFFPGNFFVSSCKYVNKLLPPDVFEVRMREMVKQLMFQRLRKQVTTRLFPDRMDYYGLDRYAIDYWIGSHPSLEPCDLSEKELGMTYWRQMDSAHSPFSWCMAPRQSDAPFDMNWMMKDKVLEDDSLRLREHFFLAGPLSRMYSLYKEGPEPFSWVWLTMPDGLVWLRANHEFGARVVEELTAEYAIDEL